MRIKLLNGIILKIYALLNLSGGYRSFHDFLKPEITDSSDFYFYFTHAFQQTIPN